MDTYGTSPITYWTFSLLDHLLDNHSWGYTSLIFRQTPRFQDFGAWSTARGRAFGGHRSMDQMLASCCPLKEFVEIGQLSQYIPFIKFLK